MTNNAKIVKKIVLQTRIETTSPLRIATGSGDGIIDTLILKTKEGIPFIPATSLAGVIRAELMEIYSKEAVVKFMGGMNSDGSHTQSMLIVNDVLLSDVDIIVRDGVAIDNITGTAIEGAKYDYEALAKGAKGNINMELTLRQYHMDDANKPDIDFVHDKYEEKNDVWLDMMATVADILTRGINVGSLTTKGFGGVKTTEDAPLIIFDFIKKKNAKNLWLKYLDIDTNRCGSLAYDLNINNNYSGNVEALENKKKKEFSMRMKMAIKSSLIIRDYIEEEVKIGDKTIASCQLKNDNEFIIPGTSVKGVLRHKAFDILMHISNNAEEKVTAGLNELMGYAAKQGKGKKSKLAVNEIYIKNRGIEMKPQTRNKIDRFTAGTIESALFTEAPIWQTDQDIATVELNVKVKDCTKEEAGLMLLLLRELWVGNLPIGGGKSIGRGVLIGHECDIDYLGKSYKLKGRDEFNMIGDMDDLEGYVTALGDKYYE